MSDALGDILRSDKYQQPPEVKIIEQFVFDAIGIKPKVAIKSESFIVTVPSAAAAGALRARIHRLQTQLGMNRRIILRIG